MKNSRLNKALVDAITDEENVTVRDIYAIYKTAEAIDVEAEQQLLLEHNRLIFQFPLYWFSTPGLLKDWQDKVLTYGFAYGSEGDKLAGKEFKVVTTSGSPQYAYQSGAYAHFSLSELLKPLEAMVLFIRMVFTPALPVYGAHKITDEELSQKAEEYKRVLNDDDWSTSLFKYLSGK